MDNEIKMGDWVKHVSVRGLKGEVVGRTVTLQIKTPEGDTFTAPASVYERIPAPLSEDEAWIEVALMVGAMVHKANDRGWDWLPEYEAKEIRHQCYILLGGNGIKVDDGVKERVRILIMRAEKRIQEG